MGCAQDRLVDLQGRFSQENGTIQDGVTLEHADHKCQAIENRQPKNRRRFPQWLERVPVRLQVKMKLWVTENVVLRSPRQADRIPDHQPAYPGVHLISGDPAPEKAVPRGKDEARLGFLGISRYL